MTFVHSDNRRLCVLRVCIDTAKFLFINVYMPYEDVNANCERTEEFISVLSSIGYLHSQYPDCIVLIGGDFNVDLDRCRSHTSILNKFCEDNDLFFAVRHSASSVDYTYQFSMMRFNTIDHFILPHMLHSTVDSLSVLHEVDNRSDHDPLFITLNIPVCYLTSSQRVFTSKTAWHKASDAQLTDYRSSLSSCLHSISVPADALTCQNVSCCDVMHRVALNKFASDITSACLRAADMCIPKTSSRGSSGVVPGWTAEVEPVRQDSIFWHNMWVQCGRPRNGILPIS